MSFRATIVNRLRIKPHNKPTQVPNPEERWAMDTMTRSEAAVRADRADNIPIAKLQSETVKAIQGTHENDLKGFDEFQETPQVQGNLMTKEYKENLQKNQ